MWNSTSLFQSSYSRDDEGRLVTPLPIREGVEPLGESRPAAVQQFLLLKCSLRQRGKFEARTMEEYFQQNHAKSVPLVHANKPCNKVFYLPMHTVSKESSRTMQLRVVFYASAKTTMTGDSMNDQPSRNLQERDIVCFKKESNCCRPDGRLPVSWKLIRAKMATSVSQLCGRPKVLIKAPLQKLFC